MSAYQHFGVMIDCSRNAVLKVSEVKYMIDCLEKMGYNTLQLYTEDTYEIEGEPYFGYLRGRYTGAEIKEIDQYAKEHGIELIPCVQTLGHFSALVRNEAYKPLVDCGNILLVDEPKTYELIDKIFATLAENFSSRFVNIGMDEAHMVGLGKYLDQNGYTDRYELLLRHLGKVVEIAKKYGFKPHMWSDLFFQFACGTYYNPQADISTEIKNAVPEDVALAYWDYYHDNADFYTAMFKKHFEFDREIWFAGGTNTWYGFAPLNDIALKLMKPAMESVRANGIKHVIMTMWGDDGKECSFFASLPSLYAIRQYADGNMSDEDIKKGFYKIFGVSFDDFMLLDIPNKLGTGELKKLNPCKSLLYNDPFMGIMDNTLESTPTIPYAEFAKTLKDTALRTKEFSYLFNAMSKLCDVLEIKAYLGIKTRKAYRAKDKKELSVLIEDYQETVTRLEAFHEAFYAVWHKENKPQGWEIQDIRLGGLSRRIKTCAKRLQDYVNGTIEKIDELEEDILPRDGFLMNNSYYDLMSRSAL